MYTRFSDSITVSRNKENDWRRVAQVKEWRSVGLNYYLPSTFTKRTEQR